MKLSQCEAIPSSCTGTMHFSNIALRSSVCQRSQSSTGYVKFRTSASLFRPGLLRPASVSRRLRTCRSGPRHRVTWVRRAPTPAPVRRCLTLALGSLSATTQTGTKVPATLAVAALATPTCLTRALAEDDNSEERAILCESGARPGVLSRAICGGSSPSPVPIGGSVPCHKLPCDSHGPRFLAE